MFVWAVGMLCLGGCTALCVYLILLILRLAKGE